MREDRLATGYYDVFAGPFLHGLNNFIYTIQPSRLLVPGIFRIAPAASQGTARYAYEYAGYAGNKSFALQGIENLVNTHYSFRVMDSRFRGNDNVL